MLDIKRIKDDPEAVKAGLRAKEVDCDAAVDRILELDAQRRALTLVDNQTTMMTGWDFDTLNYELDTLCGEFDMSDFGFDTTGAADIDNLFTEEGEPKDDSPAPKTATCPNCGETFEL